MQKNFSALVTFVTIADDACPQFKCRYYALLIGVHSIFGESSKIEIKHFSCVAFLRHLMHYRSFKRRGACIWRNVTELYHAVNMLYWPFYCSNFIQVTLRKFRIQDWKFMSKQHVFLFESFLYVTSNIVKTSLFAILLYYYIVFINSDSNSL